MKPVDHSGLRDAVDDGFGAGDADHAGCFTAQRLNLAFEGAHGALDGLGERQHLLPELGQAVARGLPLHQRLADSPLQLAQTALHRGLIDAQRTPCRQRAAMVGHGQKVLEIVPLKSGRTVHHCGLLLQSCALRRPACRPRL
jgi:hypothetical protein